MRFFKDFLRVFFPNFCVNCSNQLVHSEKVLCTLCANELPIIPIKSYNTNFITQVFYGRIHIEKGASFLYFNKKNITQKLLHQLKYKGRTDIGTVLGTWYAERINSSSFMNDIDCIIPVPIHPKKLKKRGYNQVLSFCESISKKFGAAIHQDILTRSTNTNSQTSKTRFERAETIRKDFMLLDKNLLKNKHVLLVDDVITTGATIEACCKELLKTENLKISVLSIAFTENT